MKHLNLLFIISLSVSSHASQDHLKGFNKTTDCAALMAVVSQKQQGDLGPKESVFNKIGFTLGKAENHKQDGKLNTNTEQTYQTKVMDLFTGWGRLNQAEITQKQAMYQQCLKDAELYDPKTQIPALIEKAQQRHP